MSKPDKISEAVGRRGLMLVLSSPSGAGKTSIARRLLDEDDNLNLSVSATTRPPRANEVDGRDYQFVDQELLKYQILLHLHNSIEHHT